MRWVFVKEEIASRILCNIKDPDVLKRLGLMAITFAKNIEEGR